MKLDRLNELLDKLVDGVCWTNTERAQGALALQQHFDADTARRLLQRSLDVMLKREEARRAACKPDKHEWQYVSGTMDVGSAHWCTKCGHLKYVTESGHETIEVPTGEA